MKTFFLFLLLPYFAYFGLPTKSQTRFNLKDFINSHIEEFNKPSKDCEKEETSFTYITRDFVIKNNSIEIGHLFVFDDNKGYIAISNENAVMDHNYLHGLDYLSSCADDVLIFDGTKYYTEDGRMIHSKNTCLYANSNIVDNFYWHADSNFTTQKTRYLEQDLDGYYLTRTNITNAVYHNKLTWSTEQNTNDCGPLALANLIWTYKVNNVVDLSMGATSSSELAYTLRTYVNYNPNTGVYFSDILYGDNYFSSTGYYLDYTNVANGISDTLATTPLIGFYSKDNTGHFALVTGKGNSIYASIFGINFYTYWDITNSWSDRYNWDDDYLTCKYWVDNQYIMYGFVLKDSDGNVVSLV